MVSFPAIKNTFRRAIPLSNILNKNTRKASAFGNGRILWVHNPLGSSLEKARDPYINLLTLARLSHSKDTIVRIAVAHNLTKRFKEGALKAEHEFLCKSFDPRVLVRTLTARAGTEVNRFEDTLFNSFATQPYKKFYRDLLIQFVADSVKPLVALKYLAPNITAEEVGRILSGAPSFEIKLLLIEFPQMSRKTLLAIANGSLLWKHLSAPHPKTGFYNEQLNIAAYSRLKPSLTPEELDSLADSPSISVLKAVANNPAAAQSTIEKARRNVARFSYSSSQFPAKRVD